MIEQQLEDWDKVKAIFNKIKRTHGEEKQDILRAFNEEAIKYLEKHKTKFNYFLRPKLNFHIK